MLKVTTFLKEISLALNLWTNNLYIISGLLPVGRPKTKGLSWVGLKDRIRSTRSHQHVHEETLA